MRPLTIMLVPAGVALGHLAAYGAAHPDASARDEALAGHGHFPSLALAALLLGLAAIAWAAVWERRGERVALDARRLAAWQLIAFTGLEMGERITGDLGAAALAHEPAIWLGLAAQLGIAVLLARLVVWAPRLAVALVGDGRPLMAPARFAIRAGVAASMARRRRQSRHSAARAPPSLLASA